MQIQMDATQFFKAVLPAIQVTDFYGLRIKMSRCIMVVKPLNVHKPENWLYNKVH